ncbi:MAG TPA: hypothetical protein P5081_11795 [Phycisphaerae bacterium]|nr:hypothetical protein [Phycisphaerae bacterium]HRW53563.1 hypothetical protein [Phycisphaerae bacterium]
MRRTQFVRLSILAASLACTPGMSCPALTPVTTVPIATSPLDDVQFSRFEYRFDLFSEDQLGNCSARIGTIQHAVISRTDEGLLLEISVIDHPAAGDSCAEAYSYFDTCNAVRSLPTRLLTDAELMRAAAVVDGMLTREQAGDGPLNDPCALPCFRRTYTRDDITFHERHVCYNDFHPYELSESSIAAIDQMLTAFGKRNE